MSESTDHRSPSAARPLTAAAIAVLVAAAIVGTLIIPVYASRAPMIGSWPFFYFYLLVYMPAVAIVLWIVMLLQRRLSGGGTR